MILNDIADNLSLELITAGTDLDREVTGGYVSDLISDVIGNAKEGFIWVTFQVHLNIVAAASLKNLAGIILVRSRTPDEETLKRALEEKIPILVTPLPAFEVVGRLYDLGLRCW